MENLSKQSYILVTGGSGGIGSAICRLLPSIGITPIIGFNTNSIQAYELAQEVGGFAVQINLANNNSIEKAVNIILKKIMGPNELVGIVLAASPHPKIGPFRDITSDELINQIQINVIGSQFLIQLIIKNFFRKKKSGVIVGILSKAIGTNRGLPSSEMGAYIIAKIALNGLLSVCATEYPWLNIKKVSPGYTKTQMLNNFDPRFLEILELQNKISTPEKVARFIIKKINL